MKKYLIIITTLLLTQTALAEINIYSHRQAYLLKPILTKFTQTTGIKTNVIYSPKQSLIQRMIAEGKNSPADIILTSDISDMKLYTQNKLTQPHNSKIIKNNIPTNLRNDKQGWFAISKRARILAVSKRLPKSLTLNIEDLAQAKWKGKICSRPGSHPYNRALLASIIAAHGEKFAETWGKKLVANLARKPQGNDRSQAKAVKEGLCDIAIMNSYYYGKMMASEKPEQKKWAEAIRILFTNQTNRGNHINVSTAALSHSSKNKAEAVQFLEFLTSEVAQKIYAEVNYEHPANPNVPASELVASWGEFKEDSLPIEKIAELSPKAQEIINKIKW